MEDLNRKSMVGVSNFLLLENHKDPDLFLENLRKRFKQDIIYTYIGNMLVSVNPYQQLPWLYNESIKNSLKGQTYFLQHPHIYAIADCSYRTMVEECRDACILISGESGSGKTESSKIILQYLSEIASSKHSVQIRSINDKLLKSNPILEAFGNAKTYHNNNSSRFGKYMDIEFDYLGSPIGGHINIYLLEKSRVVSHGEMEQNFHIFYRLLEGVDDETLQQLDLRRDPKSYFYLDCFKCPIELPGDSVNQFQVIEDAFESFKFTKSEQFSIFSIIASILHLGNVGFYEDDSGATMISNFKPITSICKLLECDQSLLKHALLHRTIEVNARDEFMTDDLSREQAIYARDALAKAIYERLFVWLVRKLNDSLSSDQNQKQKLVMGLLDIYGFEIFDKNYFEQFCINYCNEKLQQLLIELTLKREQEEYRRENIDWEPVDYFNNQTICNLIEEKHTGIIAYLDEECLRPGEANDLTLLAKLNQNLQSHPHYRPVLKFDGKTQVNGSAPKQFLIEHYAGDVVYEIEGFIDKNKDLLYRDLKKTMCQSKHFIIKQLFPDDELFERKRPSTTATQFRKSLANLMNLLKTKEPWYIRCIKPNANQQPKVFDNPLVAHQIKYLGLMEHLRVRRAGFAYRCSFEFFLQRYKCLCPTTWPHFDGSAREGVLILMDYLQIDPEQYKTGLTKIFIRSPETYFSIENAFQQHKHVLATQIQALYKKYHQQRQYQQVRGMIINLQAYARGYLARQELKRRRLAGQQIRHFIKGFITRHDDPNDCNERFLRQVKTHWLGSLSRQLPQSILDQSWPTAPLSCQEASEHLRKLHRKWLARQYARALSPKREEILKEKLLAQTLFKNKKSSYKASVPEPFKASRLDKDPDLNEIQKKAAKAQQQFKTEDEKMQYATMVDKFDRHGYARRPRILVITNKRLYLLQPKKMILKESLPLNSIEVIVSNRDDGLVVVKISYSFLDLQKKGKGDLILECYPHTIEMLTKLMKCLGEDKLKITTDNRIEHCMANDRKGSIRFVDGNYFEIAKSADGCLQVTCPKH